MRSSRQHSSSTQQFNETQPSPSKKCLAYFGCWSASHTFAELHKYHRAMQVHIVPLFSDNFAYLIAAEGENEAAVVDPAEPDKILAAADALGLKITTILTTHQVRSVREIPCLDVPPQLPFCINGLRSIGTMLEEILI